MATLVSSFDLDMSDKVKNTGRDGFVLPRVTDLSPYLAVWRGCLTCTFILTFPRFSRISFNFLQSLFLTFI